MMRLERSTPTTSAPIKVHFSFLLGYDVFLAVTAEVTEERDGDGCTGHDVTILECVQGHGYFEIPVYSKCFDALRAAIEEKAVECSHNSKYHVR